MLQRVEEKKVSGEPYLRYEGMVATFKVLEDSFDYKIAVVLSYSLKQAMQPFYDLFASLIVVSAIGLIVAVLISFKIGKRISNPVKKLAVAANQIAKGDFECDIDVQAKDELGDLSNAFSHMIKSIKTQQSKIIYQSRHDELTGLPNRGCFEQILEDKIIESQKGNGIFSIILMSIHQFDEINYTLGHRVGDEMVKYVGSEFNNKVKEKGFVARVSTDSFAVLLPDIQEQACIPIIHDILSLFDTPYQYLDVSIDIKVHMGVSSFPEHGGTPECLLQRADVANYLAKSKNAAYGFYQGQSDPYNKQRLTLMGELKDAIKRHELIVYLQPKLDIKSNRVLHAEALVRWEHPIRGMIPPDEFIPLAEQTGNIHQLTNHVLEETAKLIHTKTR